jgi:tetratricopeptide (TPR) repeat protein
VAFVVAVGAPAWGRSAGQEALDRGVAQYKDGKFRDALSSFERAVDLDPSLTKAWENIGWARHRLGDDREALRIWHTVLKLEPDNVPAWNAVGEVELDREAWGDAATALTRSLSLDPDQPDVRLRLGQAYEKLDRTDAAAAQYRTILDSRPGDVKATVRLADLEESLGRLDAAESLLRAGLTHGRDAEGLLTPRLARVVAKKGDAAFREERWSAAIDAFREASVRDPARPVYLVNLGWAQRHAGDNAAAVATWRRALTAGAASPADVWRAVGDAERDAGHLREALDAYARASKADPHAGSAYYALTELDLTAGDTPGAAAATREWLTSGPATEDDAVRAADLFIRHDAIEAGQVLFEDLASRGDRAAAKVGLARLYAARGGAAYRAGSDAEADGFYKKALAADPRNRAALRDDGWVLWRVGDWSGVGDVWARYVAAYPALAEPHELMGRYELQHGVPAKAIEHAHAAIAIDDAALAPKILLTKAYLADGKYHQARQQAEGLAAAYPDDLPVQTVYGETLWRSLDFPAASVQWRKVIDMGEPTPRAMHYWLRSLYETGAYDEAITQATAEVAKGHAAEPVVRLLAEDAFVRGEDAATARWYRELTERYPQRVAYWTALAETYRRMDKPGAEARALDDAFARHPRSPEIALLQADNELTRGRPSSALALYRALGLRLGRNQTVFEGEVQALRGTFHLEDALALVRAEGPAYLDANERALEEASILEELGRRPAAAELRRGVIVPRPGTVELPILLYHGLSEQPRSLNLPLDRFEAQMQALHDAGYTTVTVDDIDAMLDGRLPFPAKPIAITFDDARSDSFRYADPVLARLGMRATMFVPTVRIADESVFSVDWESLRRLAATGRWEFQAHGHLAHDPIPIDEQGGLAEFLVNREWLADEHRMESHEEFVARVEGDYAACLALLSENLPGQKVVGYAFPFSEMGQLHGGNDPDALTVNEKAFGRRFRYGFVQDATGTNTLRVGEHPVLLNRVDIGREWDADRLLAHLASASPAARARLDAARDDMSNMEYRAAERDLRAIVAETPRTYPEAGVALATDLHEQGREREAEGAYDLVPTGPSWGRPNPERRKLARDIFWETDPQAGASAQLVADSDKRDSFEAGATGRYPFDAPVDLWGSLGSAQFRDAILPTLSGPEATLGIDWFASRHVTAGGWLRGRSLGSGVETIDGQATVQTAIDGHRAGLACGVTNVETVGALEQGIERRGCQGAYDLTSRTWQMRARLNYGDLTDGNAVVYAWADGTWNIPIRPRIGIGGRLELGDSRTTSPLYYAPSQLVSLLGLVRYARSFPSSGTSIEVQAGLGPSRDAANTARVVGQGQLAWRQDWGIRWRTTLTAEYGQTPDYHRTSIALSFGYRF